MATTKRRDKVIAGLTAKGFVKTPNGNLAGETQMRGFAPNGAAMTLFVTATGKVRDRGGDWTRAEVDQFLSE